LWVTNHGARQLDTVLTTLEMLPEVAAVGRTHGMPVIFDGGVMRGSHVFKALALGADVVMLGRAVLWALAVGGAEGVEAVLLLLNRELKECMIATGCRNIQDIKQKGSKLLYQPHELLLIPRL
jgi:lactate oxidase